MFKQGVQLLLRDNLSTKNTGLGQSSKLNKFFSHQQSQQIISVRKQSHQNPTSPQNIQQLSTKNNVLFQRNTNISHMSEQDQVGNNSGRLTPRKINIFQSQNNPKNQNSLNIQEQENSYRGSCSKKQSPTVQQTKLVQNVQIQQDSPQYLQLRLRQNNQFNTSHSSFKDISETDDTHMSKLQYFRNKQTQLQQIRETNSSGQKLNYNKDQNSTDQHKRINTELEDQSSSQFHKPNNRMDENQKLNEFIKLLLKEKQEMNFKMDQMNQQNQETGNMKQLQERVERLALVIEQQEQEIETWKVKYQEVCLLEQKKNFEDQKNQILLIEQMEKQIISVIEENERLNNTQIEMEVTIKSQKQKLDVNNSQISSKNDERSSVNKSTEVLVSNLRQLEFQVETLSYFYENQIQLKNDQVVLRINELQMENQYLKEKNRQLQGPQDNITNQQNSPHFIAEADIQLQEIRDTIKSSIKQFDSFKVYM